MVRYDSVNDYTNDLELHMTTFKLPLASEPTPVPINVPLNAANDAPVSVGTIEATINNGNDDGFK